MRGSSKAKSSWSHSCQYGAAKPMAVLNCFLSSGETLEDRALFGLSPLEAGEMDPQQLAVLEGKVQKSGIPWS